MLETTASRKQSVEVPAGAVSSPSNGTKPGTTFKCFWSNFHSIVLVNMLTTGDFTWL